MSVKQHTAYCPFGAPMPEREYAAATEVNGYTMGNRIDYILFTIIIFCQGCYQEEVTIQKSTFDNRVREIKYSHNHQIDSCFTFYENKKIADAYYYSNGQIKEYRFYSINGDWCYYKTYDTNGKILKQEGEPCFFGYAETPDTTRFISDMDTLKFCFLAPTLPECSTNFYIEIEDSLYPYVYKMKDINCGYYTISDPFKKGLWELCFVMKYQDPTLNQSFQKRKCDKFLVK